MEYIKRLINLIGEEKISTYRLLCMIGAIAYVAFRPTELPVIDSLRGRLIISGLWIIVVVLSYVADYIKKFGILYLWSNIHN